MDAGWQASTIPTPTHPQGRFWSRWPKALSRGTQDHAFKKPSPRQPVKSTGSRKSGISAVPKIRMSEVRQKAEPECENTEICEACNCWTSTDSLQILRKAVKTYVSRNTAPRMQPGHTTKDPTSPQDANRGKTWLPTKTSHVGILVSLEIIPHTRGDQIARLGIRRTSLP